MSPEARQSINGNNNNQTVAETINNYYTVADQEVIDQGVILDIFNFVLENLSNAEILTKARPESLIKTEKKINRNFKKSQEKREITEYCKLASNKIALIEKAFEKLDSQDQNDIHSYILSRYMENKNCGMNNVENFYSLYKHFIPLNKNTNPTFENIAKSFVLFFFQDCTIFEKTRAELQQLKLEF